ncbi:unnamed protein product [Didymodactylos carnosus]|uniref:Uncharacterized protein n=1 Tax=Didymodactylos carnosus TaxID=1234261 RepID=A0A816EHY2_9BILA|nr:unnamed protein product [Didymodactylos carnosus]CAF4567820.1 unnamed protein product [Didymodactylos carnosus]
MKVGVMQRVKEPNEQLLLILLNIIHNISRHDDGVDALNSFNAINVIKEYQSYNKDDFLCSMILALLSTPEEIKNDRKRMNNVLDQLLEIVYDASLSSDY